MENLASHRRGNAQSSGSKTTKLKFVSTQKTIQDMTVQVPLSWTGEKLLFFYKTYHKQNTDVNFPKNPTLVLLGKTISSEQTLFEVIGGRSIPLDAAKVYVLESRQPQNQQAQTESGSLLPQPAEKEAIKIVESAQIFTLISEYIQSLFDSYDLRTWADKRQCLLMNFPFMDPQIQSLIKLASEYFGIAKDSPFEDENIRLLFNILGYKPKRKNIAYIKEVFGRDRQPNEQSTNPNATPADAADAANAADPNANPANPPAPNNPAADPQQHNPPRPVQQVNQAVFNMANFLGNNLVRLIVAGITLVTMVLFRQNYSFLIVILGIVLLQRVLQPLNGINNIPLDPGVKRALDAQPSLPIFTGIKGKLLSIAELLICFCLSMSPNWNVDLYIRLVYHSFFKHIISKIQRDREERAMHEEAMRARQAMQELEELEKMQSASLTQQDLHPPPSEPTPAQIITEGELKTNAVENIRVGDSEDNKD